MFRAAASHLELFRGVGQAFGLRLNVKFVALDKRRVTELIANPASGNSAVHRSQRIVAASSHLVEAFDHRPRSHVQAMSGQRDTLQSLSSLDPSPARFWPSQRRLPTDYHA